MEVPTIEGQVVLSVRAAQKALNAGRSTIYCLGQDGRLEFVEVEGVGTRITAASILRLLGLAVAPPPPAAPAPTAPIATKDQPRRRRRGRPRSPRGHYLPAGSQAAA